MLEPHYVAFLDLLGFSQMVEADCNAAPGDSRFVNQLLDVHRQTNQSLDGLAEYRMLQFSDSTVIARRYDRGAFLEFIGRIAEHQRALLLRGLLARGAIALGKHYSEGSFLFSGGLVSAYRLESQHAKNPRVIISPDLLDLVGPSFVDCPPGLLREHDGYCFVDYLYGDETARQTLADAVQNIIAKAPRDQSSSVAEKMRWLANYSDHKLGTAFAKPWFGSKA